MAKKKKKKDWEKYVERQVDNFRQWSYEQFMKQRKGSNRAQLKSVVYQAKAEGALAVSAQRRQNSADLFAAGINMKDMARGVSAAKKNIQKRSVANKMAASSPDVASSTANKIARNSKTNNMYEEESVMDTGFMRSLKIRKNFSVRKQEFAAINSTLTQTKEATGSVPNGMLQSALQSLLGFYTDCASLPEGSPLRDAWCPHIMEQLESESFDTDMIHTLIGYNPDAS